MLFFIKYKMFKVTGKTFARNCVHTIKVNKTDNRSVLWIRNDSFTKEVICSKHSWPGW